MRSFRFPRLAAALLPLLLLAGCASTPAPEISVARPARESIRAFSVEGRMAIFQGRNSNTVRFSWEHSPERDLMGFSGPLGNQLAELRRDARGASWTDSGGERTEAPDAETLLTRLSDTPVPLASLSDWILGRAGPANTEIERDAAGRLLAARDGAWQLQVSNYESPQANALPRLLEIRGQSMRMRLAIENWHP